MKLEEIKKKLEMNKMWKKIKLGIPIPDNEIEILDRRIDQLDD